MELYISLTEKLTK